MRFSILRFCLSLTLTLATALACMFGAGAQAPAVPIAITGQVLDSQQGFLFFTTGDGFRVDPHARVLDYGTKAPTREAVRARLFARATFDANGAIVVIEISHRPLAPEHAFSEVRKFAVALSTPAPNPDLQPNPTVTNAAGRTVFHEAPNGKPVIVTFTVQVPPTTPLIDAVYMSTDLSGWNPQAIRMDRIDALHYRVVRNLNSGTIFHYRYTRGTTLSTERAENGIERTPRLLEIVNLDVEHKADTVFHWGDESVNGQTVNPLAVPTPFNPNPFPGLPPGPRPTATPPH